MSIENVVALEYATIERYGRPRVVSHNAFGNKPIFGNNQNVIVQRWDFDDGLPTFPPPGPYTSWGGAVNAARWLGNIHTFYTASHPDLVPYNQDRPRPNQ